MLIARFILLSRHRVILFPLDAKGWLPADDVARFVLEAVERVPPIALAVRFVAGGKALYHPWLMLASLSGPPDE